ncbi:MAG: hypothetical protein LBP24_05540 [Coriobacteriales bacterium]|jgi:hypothetical protein|nr:hypothetical protein [Coriobacteriales bacterium]
MRKKQGRVVAVLLSAALAVLLLPLTVFADDASQGAGSVEADVAQADASQAPSASSAGSQFLDGADLSAGFKELTVAPQIPPVYPDISSFTLAGQEGVISNTGIYVMLPYGTDVSLLVPEIICTWTVAPEERQGFTWTIEPEEPQNFTFPIIYYVVVEDQEEHSWWMPYLVTVEVSTSVPVISAPDIWTGEGDATARLDAPYENFLQLTLNGAEVEPSNYTVSEGSTVIALHESYLKTLANGDYTFTALFTNNGSGDIFVQVSTQASEDGGATTGGGTGALPATGDTLSLELAALAALLAATGTGIVVRRVQLQRTASCRLDTGAGQIR